MKLGHRVYVIGSVKSNLEDLRITDIFDIEEYPDVMTLGSPSVVASIKPAFVRN